MKANDIVFPDIPYEFQPDAKRTKLDSHGTDVCSTLDYGKGEFTTSEETGLLPVHRHKIRLRQDLEN